MYGVKTNYSRFVFWAVRSLASEFKIKINLFSYSLNQEQIIFFNDSCKIGAALFP